jgi:hypothetical protein
MAEQIHELRAFHDRGGSQRSASSTPMRTNSLAVSSSCRIGRRSRSSSNASSRSAWYSSRAGQSTSSSSASSMRAGSNREPQAQAGRPWRSRLARVPYTYASQPSHSSRCRPDRLNAAISFPAPARPPWGRVRTRPGTRRAESAGWRRPARRRTRAVSSSRQHSAAVVRLRCSCSTRAISSKSRRLMTAAPRDTRRRQSAGRSLRARRRPRSAGRAPSRTRRHPATARARQTCSPSGREGPRPPSGH